jgi:hypothetical protein
MSTRIHSLTGLALLAGILLLLFPAGEARAHRLNAQVFLLPEHKVQVESWFDNDTKPRGAKVEVFKANGPLLARGQLDEQGIFVFTLAELEPFRVVVSAGEGHRKEVTISGDELAAKQTVTPSGSAQTASPAPIPLAEHASGEQVKDVLIGVGFLLALAAFILSLRNARQLKELRQSQNQMSGNTSPSGTSH